MEEKKTETETNPETEPESKFRFTCKRMMLTYATHLKKKLYIGWAYDKFKTQGISFIRLAHEIGMSGEEPYPHTHIVIALKKAPDFKSPRCFDYENIHPNIKKILNDKDWKHQLEYIAKEDPKNADLKDAAKPIYTKIKECKSVGEALEKYAESPCEANGIISMYKVGSDGNYRKRNKFRSDTKLRKWQEDLKKILDIEPNDRDILWIYDTEGNMGKNWFANYMCNLDKSKYRRSTDMGTSKDAATIIEGELQSGWEAWCMFINLSRGTENHQRMYMYIESIKDGNITTQKYQGKSLEFDEPHVVIFANWPPMIDQLSLDRWKIYNISSGELLGEKVESHKRDKIDVTRRSYKSNIITPGELLKMNVLNFDNMNVSSDIEEKYRNIM